jgi:signal transduction histidine kinase
MTFQSKAGHDLIRQAPFLANILDSIQAGINILDKDMNILAANTWMDRKYMNKVPLAGKKCFQAFQERTSICPWCPAIKTFEESLPSTARVPYIQEGQNRGLMEISVYPMLDESGCLEGVIEYFQDITEQVRDKEKLMQASKMASLGTLVAGVAHEINNPNNFIMLNAPLLQDAWGDALPILEKHARENGDFKLAGLPFSRISGKISKLYDGITGGSKRIKHIVNDLKDFARQSPINTGNDVDMNQVIVKTLQLTQKLINKYTDNFEVHYTDDLPLVRGDFQKLEQVVINLILNACQSLPAKSHKVSAATSYSRDMQAVLVEIMDEGEGISPEDLPRIIDPFYSTRKQTGGTGLGLAVTSSIVKDHGGVLEFLSAPGRGTRVRLYLFLKPGRHQGNHIRTMSCPETENVFGVAT